MPAIEDRTDAMQPFASSAGVPLFGFGERRSFNRLVFHVAPLYALELSPRSRGFFARAGRATDPALYVNFRRGGRIYA